MLLQTIERAGRAARTARSTLRDLRARARRVYIDSQLFGRPGDALHALQTRNQQALTISRAAASFDDFTRTSSYNGFVNIKIGDVPDFVMFSNNDDVVAKHFLYKPRDAFESVSLAIWTHFARQSSTVFDIGAFTGIYALAAARANSATRVWAFEPARNVYYRLALNVSANDLHERIAPVNVALGNREERGNIRHVDGIYCLSSGDSFLKEYVVNPHYVEDVQVVPGDGLAAFHARDKHAFTTDAAPSKVDLAKIDVEGFEVQVLEGLKSLIETHRPVMIIECNDAKVVPALRERVGDQYELLVIDELKRRLSDDFTMLHHAHSRNVLFLPRHQAAEQLEAIGVTRHRGSRPA